MEKLKAHYNLDKLIYLIEQNKYIITGIASQNALQDFGFSQGDILKIIKKLENADFYKSMTKHDNHKIWQDVYHKKISTKETAYIKLQIIDEKSVVIQFKEK